MLKKGEPYIVDEEGIVPITVEQARIFDSYMRGKRETVKGHYRYVVRDSSGRIVSAMKWAPRKRGFVASPLNVVSSDLEVGEGFKMGEFCHIHPRVRIGRGTTLRSYVELREDTVIGDYCYLDSGVKTSGKCVIGNNVTLRYDSIIARGVEIGEGTFISPQLMTENLDYHVKEIGGAKIGRNVFIGTNVTLASGITICDGAVIGSKANVRKDITEPGVYIGNPARKVK
jgi:UDP-N-acetylglucosamine acyltransferase